MLTRILKNNKGVTIAEIIIALLIMGTLAVATMGVLTNIGQSHKKRQFALDAAAVASALSEELKLYNTTDPNNMMGAPGNPPSWHLPGTTCPGGGESCWSLAIGTHTATGWLPGAFADRYPEATMIYVVTSSDRGKDVQVSIDNPDVTF